MTVRFKMIMFLTLAGPPLIMYQYTIFTFHPNNGNSLHVCKLKGKYQYVPKPQVSRKSEVTLALKLFCNDEVTSQAQLVSSVKQALDDHLAREEDFVCRDVLSLRPSLGHQSLYFIELFFYFFSFSFLFRLLLLGA
ncbi:hypothetical protein F4860DRAFT_471295 [Xylaria cubensis]|nr:hypothetical protein F4860DRAFT_471295 [Xylaria cubensis]